MKEYRIVAVIDGYQVVRGMEVLYLCRTLYHAGRLEAELKLQEEKRRIGGNNVSLL